MNLWRRFLGWIGWCGFGPADNGEEVYYSRAANPQDWLCDATPDPCLLSDSVSSAVVGVDVHAGPGLQATASVYDPSKLRDMGRTSTNLSQLISDLERIAKSDPFREACDAGLFRTHVLVEKASSGWHVIPYRDFESFVSVDLAWCLVHPHRTAAEALRAALDKMKAVPCPS